MSRLERFGRSLGNRSTGGRSVDQDWLVLALLTVAGFGLWLSHSLLVSIFLLAGAALLALLRPVSAAWSICLALPFVSHPVSVGNASFTLLEIAILMAFAGLMVGTGRAVLRRDLRAWEQLEPDLVVVVLGGAALLLAGILSLVFQLDPQHRAEALRVFRWTILEPLLAFVVMRHAIRERGIEVVFWLLVLTGGIVAVGAIGLLLADPRRFEGDGVPRAVGPYLHPNNLALYLERVFVLLVGAVVLKGVRLTRPVIAVVIALGIALLATFSRGMVPAVVAGLLLAAWLSGGRQVIRGMTVAALSGGVVLALAISQRSRASSIADFVGERRYVWNAAWDMVRDYPVSGIGMDQFLYQLTPRYIAPEAWSERYLSHPHNIVLDFWLSLGAPGVLLLISSVIMLVLWIRRSRCGDGLPLSAAAVSAITTGLVHGMVDNGYFLPDLATFTWILIALVIVDAPWLAGWWRGGGE